MLVYGLTNLIAMKKEEGRRRRRIFLVYDLTIFIVMKKEEGREGGPWSNQGRKERSKGGRKRRKTLV